MSGILNKVDREVGLFTNSRYGTEDELRKLILYKRIVDWGDDYLILDDETKILIDMSESDCCANAYGTFKNVKLDAAITDFKVEQLEPEIHGCGELTNKCLVTIYHNQNPVAQAECSANNGNGGYYYSVASLIVKDIHFPVVEA